MAKIWPVAGPLPNLPPEIRGEIYEPSAALCRRLIPGVAPPDARSQNPPAMAITWPAAGPPPNLPPEIRGQIYEPSAARCRRLIPGGLQVNSTRPQVR